MWGAWAQAATVLLFGTLLIGMPTESTLLVVVLTGIVLAVGTLVPGLLRAACPIAAGPTGALHEHLRALARRGVPRLRDPDAAGHTRSRAPAGVLPAV